MSYEKPNDEIHEEDDSEDDIDDVPVQRPWEKVTELRESISLLSNAFEEEKNFMNSRVTHLENDIKLLRTSGYHQ
jgi:hypothetical protein